MSSSLGLVVAELFDASKWITCAVSMLLIVYGSYRSMKLDSTKISQSKTRNVRAIGNSRSVLIPIDRRLGLDPTKAKSPTSPACACNNTVCNEIQNHHKHANHNQTKKNSSVSSQENFDNSKSQLKKGMSAYRVQYSSARSNRGSASSSNTSAVGSAGSGSGGSTPSMSPSSTAEGGGGSGTYLSGGGGIQVIDSNQALLMPLGASFSLLFMFFFFDSFQIFFAIAIASVSTVAFAFLVHPFCHLALKPFISLNKVSLGVLGRHLPSEVVSFFLSLSLVLSWLITGHWLLMDLLSMGLCVSLIAHIRLPSLKVSIILLLSLLVYDVFWVFFSSLIFSSNVMVHVATQPADNPVGFLARKLNVQGMMPQAPKLSLPGKLIFPSHMSWEGDLDASVIAEQSLLSAESDFILNLHNHHINSHHADTMSHYHHNMGGKSAVARFDRNKNAWRKKQYDKGAVEFLGTEDFVDHNSRHRLKIESKESNLGENMQVLGIQNSDRSKIDYLGGQASSDLLAEHMHYSMLGLGDIVMPGLLLCFVLRFDSIRGRSQNIFSVLSDEQNESSGGGVMKGCVVFCCGRITCFHSALVGYVIGLVCATLCSDIFQQAQPALLYIVPATLLPLIIVAYLKNDLKEMWQDPFVSLEAKMTPSHSRNSSLDFFSNLNLIHLSAAAAPNFADPEALLGHETKHVHVNQTGFKLSTPLKYPKNTSSQYKYAADVELCEPLLYQDDVSEAESLKTTDRFSRQCSSSDKLLSVEID